MSKHGFTLIEIAIVIAIVGVIAAAIIVPIQQFPDTAEDATNKTALASLKTIPPLFLTKNEGNSAGLCEFGELVEKIDEINTQRAETEDPVICRDGDDSGVDGAEGEWVIFMRLIEDPTKAFCMDKNGTVEEIDITDIGSDAKGCSVSDGETDSGGTSLY